MIKEIDIIELISFLNLHYVEDDKFKLCYSEENIKWSISDGKIYGYYFKNKLIGTIAFNKIKLNINNTINDYYEINFLCCHTEYRHNGIAKKLIDHVIFDAIANKIYFGFFTGGTFHKKYNYISLLNYYHHPINVKKLYECDFINLINDISFTEEYYKINNIILY
jgi:ribosomal protein S18 acetylase RimI-like enzyme